MENVHSLTMGDYLKDRIGFLPLIIPGPGFVRVYLMEVSYDLGGMA